MIEAIVTIALATIAGLAWLWRIHETNRVNTVKIERNEVDIADAKAEVRTLRDGHVRTETLLQTLTGQLGKMDAKLDRLIESKHD